MSNLNTKQDSEFVRAVDDIVRTGKASKTFFHLGTTPDAWKLVGIEDRPVDIYTDCMTKAMREYLALPKEYYPDGREKGNHNISPETLKQIPEQLNNPVAIFKSSEKSSNPDGYVVLTELIENDAKTGEEKPVIAALHLREVKNKGIEIIDIKSVYGRWDWQIENAIERFDKDKNAYVSDLLYWDKTKGHQLANSFGLQLPTWLNPNDDLSERNVKTNADLMQYREEKKYNNPNLNYSQTGAQGLVLEEFGAANYQFNKNNEMSFYVKVRDENNKLSTIWGVGLEEAINTAGAKKNDLIYLKKLGKEKVLKTLKVPVFDQNGLPVFDYENNEQVFEKKEKYVDRIIWDIQVLQPDENLEQKNAKTSANQAYSTSQKQSETKAKTPVIHSKIINSEYQKLLERSRDFLNLVQERKLEVSEYEQFMGINNQLEKCPELYKSAMQVEIPQIIGNFGINHLEILTLSEAKKQYPELNPQAEGFFDREKEKTVLIADMFLGKDMQQAAFVAFHELGHRGIAVEGLEKWQKWILAAYENPTIKQIADQFKTQYKNHYDQLNLDETQRTMQATEEALVEVYAAVKTGNWELLEERRQITIADEFKSERNTVEALVAEFEIKIHEIFGVTPDTISNDNVHALLKGLDNPNPSLNIKTQNNVAYSLDEQNNNFVRAVDDIANGKEPKGEFIRLGTSPDVWQLIGIPEVKVSIQDDRIQKIMGEYLNLQPHEHSHSHIHNLTPEQVKQLPEQLNDPIAILQSAPTSTNPDGFLVLTELLEKDKKTGEEKPVVAALNLVRNRKDNEIRIVNVTTAFGRDNWQTERDINNGLLKYWNIEKGQKLNTASLQLPTDVTSSSALVANNIKTEKDLSQYLEQKISYSLDTSFLDKVNIFDHREYKKYAQSDYLPDGVRERIYAYAEKKVERSPITYLAISQEEKDEARKAGNISYDVNLKCWYCKKLTPELEKYLPDASKIHQSDIVQKKGINDCRAVLEAYFGRSFGNNFDTSMDKWHRVLTASSKNSSDTKGAYRFFYGINDRALMCSYRIMGENEIHTWTENISQAKKIINPHAQAINAQKILQVREQTEINAIAKIWMEKARGEIAAKIYSLLPQAKLDDPYIAKKEMLNISDMRRLDDGSTIIPLYGAGKLRNLQCINPNGEKRYMSGATKQNSYFFFKSDDVDYKNPQIVFLAEGVATAESVFRGAKENNKNNFLVIVCLDCNGIEKIADIVEQKYPNAKKIIAADNDIGTYERMLARKECCPKNAGLENAERVQGKYPNFEIALPKPIVGENGERLNTDWNDVVINARKKGSKTPFAELNSRIDYLLRENKGNKEEIQQTKSHLRL